MQTPVDAQQSQRQVRDTAVLYSFDSQRSTIFVVTRRSGLLSFLGHDHAILAREWDGRLCAEPVRAVRGQARIRVVTSSLEIDADTVRALAGLGRGPSPDQRRKLQATMLDQDHIDSAGHPEIVLEMVDPVEMSDGDAMVPTRITIRGVTHDVEVPVKTTTTSEHTRFQGVMHVAQSTFGIRPESIGGVIRVADVVAIHFDLRAVPTAEGCTM